MYSMKKICIGILAHVDAGKTTLTESILFLTGTIRSQGRVDNGDAYLDTEALEKKRGVTIHSKQAVVQLDSAHDINLSGEKCRITIIDTPGHTDFVGETERAMSVMDLAVLLISAPDGVTDSGRKLVNMLNEYKVPYIVFVNKMDMSERREDEITEELINEFGQGFVSMNRYTGIGVSSDNSADSKCHPKGSMIRNIPRETLENIASLSEDAIEKYLENDTISDEDIMKLICSGQFHPVLFGSALKNVGTEDLVTIITRFLPQIEYKKTVSAKVFKVTYEEGHKLSFVKVTGGRINVRDSLPDDRLGGEKITQIRRYSGGRYDTLEYAEAGDAVTLLGPERTFTGMGIGEEIDDRTMISRPVLRYRMILPDDVPVRTFIPRLKELAAEDPLLNIDTQGDVISLSVMGEFQLEILTATIDERFNIHPRFDRGEIIYKETIADSVIGFGHFEPLRHYAEVQLVIEPLPLGSGIEVATAVSVNELGINWQKNIMSTIMNDLPTGVLTGSELTDIRFTVVGGRSHVKHTEGGDFREATRRAIRQGLMKTGSLLLEPYYEFRITLPAENLGRALNDIGVMGGTGEIADQNEQTASIKGEAPARELMNYQATLVSYTAGQGHIDLGFAGYRPCSDEYALSVMENRGYDPDSDMANPSGSVFVSHGAGEYIPWFECEAHMHIPSRENELLYGETETEEEKLEREAELQRRIVESRGDKTSLYSRLDAIGTDEIDEILRKTTHANAVGRKGATKRVYHQKRVITAETAALSSRTTKPPKSKPKYLLVDGYNIIYAWDELKSLLNGDMYDMDGAKYRLLDILSEYRVIKDTEIIVVFDAYKVKGHVTEKMDYMGVHIVYTRTAETADQYIARFTLENARNLDITVATSDGLIQLIIRSENSKLMSARDLREDISGNLSLYRS